MPGQADYSVRQNSLPVKTGHTTGIRNEGNERSMLYLRHRFIPFLTPCVNRVDQGTEAASAIMKSGWRRELRIAIMPAIIPKSGSATDDATAAL